MRQRCRLPRNFESQRPTWIDAEALREAAVASRHLLQMALGVQNLALPFMPVVAESGQHVRDATTTGCGSLIRRLS